MHLQAIDWIIIGGYVVLALGAGVLLSGKASGSISDYFLAGRKLPWWFAGTSIVATTFAADTPLAVAGMIRRGGIYENWFWWSAAMSAMLGVAFYARLWRRAGLTTDVEFIELRGHPFWVGTQAHPELKSRPTRAAPLFRAFMEAALARAEGRRPHLFELDPEHERISAE